MSDLKIWYQSPAQSWNEALPVGNGRLGGMVFGNIHHEHIQLNQDSMWSGGWTDRNNKDTKEYLEVIRRQIFNGEIRAAQKNAILALTGTHESQCHYEPLGDINLLFWERGNAADYRRELALQTGIASVNYVQGDCKCRREVFASYPEQLLITRLEFSRRYEEIWIQLNRGRQDRSDIPIDTRHVLHPVAYQGFAGKFDAPSKDMIAIEGESGGKNGIGYCCMIKAVAEDGVVEQTGDYLVLRNIKAVTLLLAGTTTFYDEFPMASCMDRIKAAGNCSYDELKRRHVEDHKALFDRVEFTLSEDKTDGGIPTDKRIKLAAEGKDDLNLTEMLFQYGRYLMIAGSRPGSMAANLQGIWNDSMMPPWDSKYTININTQMNYWPAEICNLSECHQPLFDLIDRMHENGKKTARVMYGCRGAAAHHNTDIWGDTAPQDTAMAATFWPMGLAWLSIHLWEHYEFTLDRGFLKKSYPIFQDAVLFFLDYLVENEEGELVCGPSVSPENFYITNEGTEGALCMGSSIDQQLIRELFQCFLEAGRILGAASSARQEAEEALKKLKKVRIGKYGQIMEWDRDYEEYERNHRHYSPLFSLYPRFGFLQEGAQDLYHAAEVTFNRRMEDDRKDWSLAWAVCLLARMHRGEDALRELKRFISVSVCGNLFNGRDVFQIDGNFGITAGIAEMLLQSYGDVIQILPALPKEWRNGKLRGLKARGGFEVDIEWKDGELLKLKITGEQEGSVKIRYRDIDSFLPVNQEVAYTDIKAHAI